MNKINNVTFTDFKFFNGDFSLDLLRKNVLIYGENGSGKSSIYWGLHCFLNSSAKTTQQVKKYFDNSNTENIVNIYSDGSNSKIKVVFENGKGNESSYTISYNTQNTNVTAMKEALISSDFLTYKIIFQIYNFRNSESIDLFPLWESDLLETISFDINLNKVDGTSGNNNAKDWWDYIKDGITPRPRMHDLQYRLFKNAEEGFNTSLRKYINSILENTNKFLEKFNQNFSVSIEYTPCIYDGFEKNSTTKRTHIMERPEIILKVKHNSPRINAGKEILHKPHTFLNEAKLATIALSMRFAMLKERLNTVNGTKILVIDDLLLSLDMSNRELVLRILFNEFSDFQIIMLTHDKLFYEFTKHNIKRFSGENWLFWEMYEKVENGIPKPYKRDSKSYLENAEYYFNKNEYDIAGNFLRKEAENFLKKLLPKRMQYTKDYSLCDLNGLITNSIVFATSNIIDTKLFNELDSYRKFVLNPTSHDSYDVPKYKSEIENCISTLKFLNEIKIEPIFSRGECITFSLKTPAGDDYKFDVFIEDDLKQIRERGKDIFISKGNINYHIYKNGVLQEDEKTKTKLRHSNENLKSFYEKNYEKSDKTQSPDFWKGIMVVSNGLKLESLKTI